MIEFVTLFLGLVTGVHPVALAVSPEVATMEVRLDGEVVAVLSEEPLSEEPWTFQCDFGTALEAHELEAVAWNEAGREVQRLSRWINVVAPQPDSTPSTALLIRLADGVDLPAPEAMGSWFLKGGRPLEVERVEKGTAEVVFLRDPEIPAFLEARSNEIYDGALSRLGKESGLGKHFVDSRVAPLGEEQKRQWRDLDLAKLAPNEVAAVELAQDYLRSLATLGPAMSVRFVSPQAAAPSRVSNERRIFHRSRRLAAEEGGFLWLTNTTPTVLSHFRLADALAVSARKLHGASQRRALVVLLAQSRKDSSLYSPALVQSYLRQLQVPVEIWSLTSAEPHPDWGEALDLRPDDKMRERPWDSVGRATEALSRRLESQRVVWLRGRHLPQSIELSAEARGVWLEGGGRSEPTSELRRRPTD